MDRQVFRFEYEGPVTAGFGVYVYGDLPELGAGSSQRGLPLVAAGGSKWRLDVALPPGVTFTYQYIQRTRAAGCSFATTPLSDWESATTSPSTSRDSLLLLYRTDFVEPIVHWRQGTVQSATPLKRVADGRTPAEGTWLGAFGSAGRAMRYFVVDAADHLRDPLDGEYETAAEAMLIQDGEAFTYFPAPSVSPARRDYNSPPSLDSSILGHARTYRVFLPRGYDEHSGRRYPVAYVHDGDQMFDGGSQSFDRDGATVIAQTRGANAREIIVVAIDPYVYPGLNRLQSRLTDYVPTGDSDSGIAGQADRYVQFILDELKPWIDAEYRTLPSAQDTATIGWSLGGLLAVHMGWDHPDSFQRIGSWSGSFWLGNFPGRIGREARRDLRVYLDSGDDNYQSTLDIRDRLALYEPPYVLERDLRYVYECGGQHEPAANARRWPRMLTFLFPSSEDSEELLTDCNANGVPDSEDIGNGTSRDTDGNGIPDECDPDCDLDDTPDSFELAQGTAADCDGNGVLDECEVSFGYAQDCNGNGRPDGCDIEQGESHDCDGDGVPDECQLLGAEVADCDGNGVPDTCEVSRFAVGTRGSPSGVDPVDWCGPPDGGFVGLGTDSVTLDFGALWILDGPGPDLNVYEGDDELILTGVEFTKMTVLVSEDGMDYQDLKSSEGPAVEISGAEGHNRMFVRSYDLALAGLPAVRFVRIQGLGTGGAGERNGFDLDAVGAIHFTACLRAAKDQFSRGDANADGALDLSDAVFTLGYQFLGGAAPTCLDAADANDDGQADISDAIYGLAYLFLGGPMPPAPYPSCGEDPTDDTLGCESFAGCP